MQVDTEYSGSAKPKSHPLRLIADALRAQSTSESTTAEDDNLWDAIKKASFTDDASEGSSDTAPGEPIPIFSNVFSDDTIRLLSLIPVDIPDKDKSTPAYSLRSPISPDRSRSFSLPETPHLAQTDRGRPPPSGHVIVAPNPSANNNTAPTTASPETPADWLQFSSQGFGTISGTRDLIATLWDDDVEVTAPPTVPLSRKSSRRARSRHSSLDSARTPVPPLPTTPAAPISSVTLIAKVKLDEAFIDFWADSLLDPISKRWPRFVLCQLKPLFPTLATPTPAWLVIEQRFFRPTPVSPVKEEAAATVPSSRPRASSPRGSPRTESSRLSAAFSIVSKKRFALFTGGSGDPKSPKDDATRLSQVDEVGDGVNGIGDGTAAAEEPEEVEARDGVDGDVTRAVTTVDAAAHAAVGVSAIAVAVAREDITQTPRGDDTLAETAVTAPSKLAGVLAPNADEPMKDEPPHSVTSQNGLANHEHHDEEQREPEADMAVAQGPTGDDAAVIPPVLSVSVKTETEPALSGVEAEATQPEPAGVPPHMASIGEGTIAQAEVAPLEPASLELSAPEPSSIPVVEEATLAEEKDTVPTTPQPAVPDAPTLEEPQSTSAPAAEPAPVPAESPLVQEHVPMTAAVIEEPLEQTAALQVAELEPAVEAKATAQAPPADEASPDTEWTHTLEEVPAPDAQPVLVSEMLDVTSPEGVTGDSPIEPVSVAAPLPVSEQPESDISAVGATQVVASADLAAIVVEEDRPTTEPELVPTDDAVSAVPTSSADELQAVDSVDAVEMTAPLEEQAPIAEELVIEDDAQPIAIPEREDAIPDEPDVGAPAPESATMFNDTAFSAPESTDSTVAQAPLGAPAPIAEPDAEHEAVVTQSAEENLVSHATPQVQDPVIDEQPSAEETTPIPEASASESIPTGDPATLHEDETDVAPPELAVAEGTVLGTRVLVLVCVLTLLRCPCYRTRAGWNLCFQRKYPVRSAGRPCG